MSLGRLVDIAWEVARQGLDERGAHAGYRLEAAEVDRLYAAMDIGRTGWLAKSQLAASQIDWRALQARPWAGLIGVSVACKARL